MVTTVEPEESDTIPATKLRNLAPLVAYLAMYALFELQNINYMINVIILLYLQAALNMIGSNYFPLIFEKALSHKMYNSLLVILKKAELR